MSDRFSLLRKLLKALGLSEDRIDELFAWIETWLEEDSEDGAGSEREAGRTSVPASYHLRDDFLSPAERQFFHVLYQAVTPWAVICPKVRLGDIFYAQTPSKRQWYIARNKIERKHLDFLLCNPETMQPMLGVELNDSSHDRPQRKKRDRFVMELFDEAGLPLVGIRVQRQYDAEQLRRFLRHRAGLNGASTESNRVSNGPQESAAPSSLAPDCPNCGTPMVLRTVRSGANQGNQFWGCPNYPRCRGIVQVAG